MEVICLGFLLDIGDIREVVDKHESELQRLKARETGGMQKESNIISGRGIFELRRIQKINMRD